MRIKFIALALAAVLPIAGAQAADRMEMRQQWQQANQEALMQELNLDQAQRQKFLKKNEAFRNNQMKQRQDFQEKQQRQRDHHRKDMHKLLNPEQQVIFDRHHEKMNAIRDSRRQNFGQPGNRGQMQEKNFQKGNKGQFQKPMDKQQRMQPGMNQRQGGQPMRDYR